MDSKFSHDVAGYDSQNNQAKLQAAASNKSLPGVEVDQVQLADKSAETPVELNDSSTQIESKMTSLVELVRTAEDTNWGIADLAASDSHTRVICTNGFARSSRFFRRLLPFASSHM